MTTVHRSALVPYSAQEMCALVADIPAYPKFLPWCGGARVLSQEGEIAVASIAIAYAGVHKSFTTRNRLQAGRSLEMELVEGPFKRLHGMWRFEPLDADGCRISLDLEFEFANRLVALAISPAFTRIANELVDSFVRRAHEQYGRKGQA